MQLKYVLVYGCLFFTPEMLIYWAGAGPDTGFWEEVFLIILALP